MPAIRPLRRENQHSISGIAGAAFFFDASTTMASVVRIKLAIDAALAMLTFMKCRH